MAVVWLDEAGWGDGELPDVCLECGGPAPDRVRKTFVYQPAWAYLFIFLGLLGLAIAILVTRKQRHSLVPMCPEHENYWRNRNLWAFGTFLIAILVATLGVVAANQARVGDVPILVLGVILSCLIGWLVAVAVIHHGTIRATEFSTRSIKLTKVSPEFVDAYEEYLDEEKSRAEQKTRRDRAARQRWNESPTSPERGERRRPLREDRPEDEPRRGNDNIRSDDY